MPASLSTSFWVFTCVISSSARPQPVLQMRKLSHMELTQLSQDPQPISHRSENHVHCVCSRTCAFSLHQSQAGFCFCLALFEQTYQNLFNKISSALAWMKISASRDVVRIKWNKLERHSQHGPLPLAGQPPAPRCSPGHLGHRLHF